MRTGVVTEESVERNRQSGEERKTEVAARRAAGVWVAVTLLGSG